MLIDDLLIQAALAMGPIEGPPAGSTCKSCGNQFCREKGIKMELECKEYGYCHWEPKGALEDISDSWEACGKALRNRNNGE